MSEKLLDVPNIRSIFNKWVAKLWRKMCGETFLVILAAASFKTICTLRGEYCKPDCPSNKYSLGRHNLK